MTPQTVHLYVLEGLADWEPGFAIAHLNVPAFQARPGRFRVATVGATRSPVRTQGGVTIVPDQVLEELRPEQSAMLILPGSSAWEAGAGGEAVEKAREFLEAGVPVAAICGATFALARHGLLDERRHTSAAPQYLAMTGYRGSARYVNALAVTDGDLITASPVGAVEFARAIFERLEVYSPQVLEAWYALFKHGEAERFFAMAQQGDAASASP